MTKINDLTKAMIIKKDLDSGKITSKESTKRMNNEFILLGGTGYIERTNKLRKKLGLKNDLK